MLYFKIYYVIAGHGRTKTLSEKDITAGLQERSFSDS